MADEMLNWPERRLDLRLLVSSWAGKAVAIENLHGQFLSRAGAAFANNDNHLAITLRNFAAELKTIAEGHRKKQAEFEKLLKEEFKDER